MLAPPQHDMLRHTLLVVYRHCNVYSAASSLLSGVNAIRCTSHVTLGRWVLACHNMIVNTLPARQAALPSVAKCKLRTPVTRVLCFKGPQMTPPVGPPRHSVGGPTGGLVDKIKELGQRLKDTPGDTLQDRINTWYDRRVSEHAADATGVTWPSTRITRLWKFFFKAGQGTTDRFGFAIKLAPVDQVRCRGA